MGVLSAAAGLMDFGAMLAICLLLGLTRIGQAPRYPGRALKRKSEAVSRARARNQRKPDWVIAEVLRLKALAPTLSCRNIESIFNRRFATERRMTVGRTWVNDTLRKHKADILRLRREFKHRVPRPVPRNRVWGLDLTGKADLTGRQRLILGMLDHGSRACLALRELTDKRSLTILRELILAFRQFGIPRATRTDNERCLTSGTMRFALVLLGVKHQTTDPGCPWMNGRIERFFGTLKAVLDRIHIADDYELACRLIEFRAWYNHVRMHQHLDGHTPAEAWDGREKSRRFPRFFEIWDGMLRGWYFPP